MAPVDETTGQLADLFLQVGRQIRVRSTAELAPVGLTHAQSRALRIVARADGPMRMTDIADALGIVPRAATTVIDALEEAGLVTRGADSNDRRAIVVSLTGKGRRLRERLSEARLRAAEAVFAPLSPADQRQLLRLLRNIGGECAPQRGIT
jgi:DNA-binding MarR family transcriptional regulator